MGKWFLHDKTINGQIAVLPECESTLRYAEGHVIRHLGEMSTDEAFRIAEEENKKITAQVCRPHRDFPGKGL